MHDKVKWKLWLILFFHIVTYMCEYELAVDFYQEVEI